MVKLLTVGKKARSVRRRSGRTVAQINYLGRIVHRGTSGLLHSVAPWSSLVARRTHNPKVSRSNRLGATNSAFRRQATTLAMPGLCIFAEADLFAICPIR
jgi:hypothetical protein